MSWSLIAGAYTGVYFGYINVNQPVVLKFFCGSGQLARLTHVATLTLTCLIYPSFLTPPADSICRTRWAKRPSAKLSPATCTAGRAATGTRIICMLVPRPHPYYSSRHHDATGVGSLGTLFTSPVAVGRERIRWLFSKNILDDYYRHSTFHYRGGGKKDFTKPGNDTRGLVLMLPWPISGPIFARSIAKIFLEGITR